MLSFSKTMLSFKYSLMLNERHVRKEGYGSTAHLSCLLGLKKVVTIVGLHPKESNVCTDWLISVHKIISKFGFDHKESQCTLAQCSYEQTRGGWAFFPIKPHLMGTVGLVLIAKTQIWHFWKNLKILENLKILCKMWENAYRIRRKNTFFAGTPRTYSLLAAL